MAHDYLIGLVIIQMPKLSAIFLGDTAVGKTTLLKRASEGVGVQIQPTIGVDNIFYHSTDVTLQCWDTSGSNRFVKVIPLFARKCDIAVYVFDARRPETLHNVRKWHKLVSSVEDPPKLHVLVANFVSEGQRVQTEGFEEFDVLDGRNPQDVMEEIITKICTHRESFDIELETTQQLCCFGLC
jgi:GTPase SAR1 family protein